MPELAAPVTVSLGILRQLAAERLRAVFMKLVDHIGHQRAYGMWERERLSRLEGRVQKLATARRNWCGFYGACFDRRNGTPLAIEDADFGRTLALLGLLSVRGPLSVSEIADFFADSEAAVASALVVAAETRLALGGNTIAEVSGDAGQPLWCKSEWPWPARFDPLTIVTL